MTVLQTDQSKTSLQQHPYADFIHRVEKPSRYLGGEHQSVIKDHLTVRVTMALCFPDLYEIGMSHLGQKILYSLLNKESDLCVERAFCPWPDMERELRKRHLPILTLETHQPLNRFDVVGFSLQYEMTYTNVLTMLDLGQIPLRSEDRTPDAPLVIAGGPNVTHPEPMAPFIDLFLIGDGEEQLPILLRRYAELKQAGGRNREEMLLELAAQDGIYCPALYTRKICERSGLMVVDRPKQEGLPEKIRRSWVQDINRYPFPDDSPVASAEAVFDRMSIEIARGCTEGCRFCQAGMINRPLRERDPAQIIETLISAVDQGGYDEAALTSLSTADYSCITPLIERLMEPLRERRVGLGISSLRAYGLDETLLDEIASVKATGLTFAPEAGTQRLRDAINKNITEEDIFRACHRVFSKGWSRMKLYFMIGLPTETEEDVRAIFQLGREAVKIGRMYLKNKKPVVTISVSSHVPRPHTPFQRCALDSMEVLAGKQHLLEDLCRRERLNFRKHDLRVSLLEGLLARGDIRVGDLLEKVWRQGARFDAWDEQLRWPLWEEALDEFERATGISHRLFLDPIPMDGRLPWDHIDVGLTDRFLHREFRRSLENRPSPPCGKPGKAEVHQQADVEMTGTDDTQPICYHCGLDCNLNRMQEERREYLEKLQALPLSRPSGTASAERFTALDRINRGMPAHDFQQGSKFRYRLKYAKLGAITLQGHLDLLRTIPRIFRRAKLPLYYSEGYSPKPVMAFTPALALGMSSLAEYVDFALCEELPEEQVDRQLRAHTEPGIEILGVRRLGQGSALSKVLRFVDFAVEFPPAMDRDTVEKKIEQIRSIRDETLDVRRKRKGRRIRLWDCVEHLRLLDNPDPERDTSISRSENAFQLEIRLRLKEDASLKPSEIVHHLFGIEIHPTAITRTGWIAFDRAGEPVDPLEAFE